MSLSQMLPSSSTGTRQKESTKKNTHTKEREREREREKKRKERAHFVCRPSFFVRESEREREPGVCVVCLVRFLFGERNLVVCLFVCFDCRHLFLFFLEKGTLLSKISLFN
jgi:hypothetical protein